MTSFSSRLEKAPAGEFVVTYELVPARAAKGKVLDDILTFARLAADDGRIAALSITDNAGGNPALSPKALGREIKALGIDPVIHFSCKDKNRNTIESELFELDRLGLDDLLVLTGDYPRYGIHGNAKPVFDLDSVQVLDMITDMNRGLVLDPRVPGGGVELPPARFHAGCVVSPFKRTEAEQVLQYVKLKRKIRAGARFVVTQMGFDVRKFDELLRFMRLHGMRVPVLATVFVPDARIARVIHRGLVPGCTLPARLLSRIEEEARGADQGEGGRIERAARLVALLRGIGYDGVHLSGPRLEYGHVRRILDRAEEVRGQGEEFVRKFLFPEEWPFWFFREDRETGLNTDAQVPLPGDIPLGLPDVLHLRASILVHEAAFSEGRGLYPLFRRIAGSIRGTRWERPFTCLEYAAKRGLYGCEHCGDCTLSEVAFLCPQSRCAKYLLNGPCGGSRDGWCEVWPGERRCIYVLAYKRLAHLGRDPLDPGGFVPPRNWALYRTSSWINYYLGLDYRRHRKRRFNNSDPKTQI